LNFFWPDYFNSLWVGSLSENRFRDLQAAHWLENHIFVDCADLDANSSRSHGVVIDSISQELGERFWYEIEL